MHTCIMSEGTSTRLYMGNFPRLYMAYFPRLCMGIAVLCRFVWPRQGIAHRVNSEQNVKVL